MKIDVWIPRPTEEDQKNYTKEEWQAMHIGRYVENRFRKMFGLELKPARVVDTTK